MTVPTLLFVCPTSHMDWDWKVSFEEYYKTYAGPPDSPNPARGTVQSILDAAVSLVVSGSGSNSFRFSIAEVGWLQRYLVDQGGTLPSALAQGLCLMGGAITSPDNLVCNGEVFVRTYLVGRQWAQSVGLGAAISNVSWMPDDYGHDPELPVILSAMGLTAVGFARVPGAFPLFASPLKTNGTQPPSLACTLMTNGVAFYWLASDGSSVFAHFMPNMYGVPFYSQGTSGSDNCAAWQAFVKSTFLTPPPGKCSLTAVEWPGGVAFAPAGGDFAIPDAGWVNGVIAFGTTASIGTFSDYVAAVDGAGLTTTALDPSNFYTGYFGSRPVLKILQARASRELMAAEAVSSLLRLGSLTSGATLDALDGAIGQVWSMLAPSSHHDFVTGTSPDVVYKMEQFPMMSLAANAAKGLYRQALQIIADSIPTTAGTLVVVHNAVGVDREGVFELDRGSAVTFPTSGAATVQPLAGGGLLVQAPLVQSLGYVSGVVTFGKRTPPQDPVAAGDEVTINNNTLAITLSQSNLWGITSIMLGDTEMLPSGAAANVLQIYDDTGNLYQYGNEPDAGPPSTPFGTFAPQSGGLTAGKAVQTEFGPLRWRVEAEVIGTDGVNYLIVYTLIAGESLVRMSVTGGAPAGTTVVTTIPAIATDGATKGTHLIYGTAHHFHENQVPAYWEGPLFKATHDFLMPAADTAGATFNLAAIYHGGMPAWACDQGLLLGSLFRNTNGSQRSAQGTDTDTPTQRYALRISTTALVPAQGAPLVEALQVTNPLRAALASATNQPEWPVTLPPSGSLASTDFPQSPALVRVARPMGELKGPATAPQIQAQVALRLYRPDADGTPGSVVLTIPLLASDSGATAELITALEEPVTGAVPLDVENGAVTVAANYAITTVAVTAPRPTTGG